MLKFAFEENSFSDDSTYLWQGSWDPLEVVPLLPQHLPLRHRKVVEGEYVLVTNVEELLLGQVVQI